MVNVVSRAKQILFDTDQAWKDIGSERASAPTVLFRYALPLAAIGPVTYVAGAKILGLALPDVHWLQLIAAAVALNLAAVIAIAAATLFVSSISGGLRTFNAALILACYSATSFWIASVAVLAPERALFGVIVFAGLLHSLYVFYLGFSTFLRVPHDEAGVGTAVVITLTLAAFVALGWGLAYII
jgi:Yip1 domain